MGLPGTVEGYYIIELLILSSSSPGFAPASVHSQRASHNLDKQKPPKPMEADDRVEVLKPVIRPQKLT
jgi:hypothetical protein